MSPQSPSPMPQYLPGDAPVWAGWGPAKVSRSLPKEDDVEDRPRPRFPWLRLVEGRVGCICRCWPTKARLSLRSGGLWSGVLTLGLLAPD